MNRAVVAALGLLAGVAAFVAYRRQSGGGITITEIENAFSEGVDYMQGSAEKLADSFGFWRVSNMASVDKNLVSNRNVRAVLAVIRRGEGTSGADGYRTLYGGGTFASFADHPRQAVTKWGRTSTAAGAYQFLSSVWDETRQKMGLTDFTPASQDLAALGRIAARGVLADVLAGRLESAISGNGGRGHGLRWEWASLPGSPYGQGTISLATAQTVFGAAGGSAVYA